MHSVILGLILINEVFFFYNWQIKLVNLVHEVHC